MWQLVYFQSQRVAYIAEPLIPECTASVIEYTPVVLFNIRITQEQLSYVKAKVHINKLVA